MNNDVIKMLFKKKENKQEDEYNKIINSNLNTLETFNRMYGLSIKGNETEINLTFNNKMNKSSPLLKITTKGFLLFCKNKFLNLNKLVFTKEKDVSNHVPNKKLHICNSKGKIIKRYSPFYLKPPLIKYTYLMHLFFFFH